MRNNTDFEDGPAEEIKLSSAGVEAGVDESRDPHLGSKVKVLVESAGCGEAEAERHLGACGGDLDAALEAAIAAMAAPGGDDGGDGAEGPRPRSREAEEGGHAAEGTPGAGAGAGEESSSSAEAPAAPDPQGRDGGNAKWTKKPSRNKPW